MSEERLAMVRDWVNQWPNEPESDDLRELLNEVDRLRAENAELRAQVTRCQEENTREVKRRREAEQDRDHWKKCFGGLKSEREDRRRKAERERDELKARLEALVAKVEEKP